jgi:hypothetical protein
MKPFLTILILAASLCSIPVQGRTLQDINVISPRVLKRSVSPKFFKSLLISPVDGWIVVRANLVNNRLSGARVLRSELGGAYDQLALRLAKDLEIAGFNRMENPHTGGPSVLLHLLVYQIADGTMVLSFPTLDDAGGNQLWYWGCARLAVVKRSDGSWVEIEGPEGLHAKGWAVRGVTDQWNNDPAPSRPKHQRPKFTPPGASVLGPIIASTRR